MTTEETTVTEENREPTFAEKVSALTTEWKDDLIHEATMIATDKMDELMDGKIETAINNLDLSEHVRDNFSDAIDYNEDAIERIVESWVDYNLDVDDKIDDWANYTADWNGILDNVGIGDMVADQLGDQFNDFAETWWLEKEDDIDLSHQDERIKVLEQNQGDLITKLNVLQNILLHHHQSMYARLHHFTNDTPQGDDA